MGRQSNLKKPQPIAPPLPFAAELWEAVRKRLELSNQQAAVLAWIIAGKRDKEIEELAQIGTGTIRTYLERMFAKMGVRNRVQLVVCVFEAAMKIERQNAA